MSELLFISWWMCAGLILRVLAVLLMVLIGALKRAEKIDFNFIINFKEGVGEAVRDIIDNLGFAGAMFDLLISALLWPISVYLTLTGKYSWN